MYLCFAMELILLAFMTAKTADLRANWEGPISGPLAQTHKRIVYVAADFRNGGVSSVYRGLEAAGNELSWTVSIIDGLGTLPGLRQAVDSALALRPNGLILGGFQIDEVPDLLQSARKAQIALVGWHAGARPGAPNGLFFNVSTEPRAVAHAAVEFVIKISHGTCGLVIFTDSRFEVANAKTRMMQELISGCKKCKLLAVEDLAISEAREKVPGAVERLNEKFGRRWTHTLAINDVYFDNIHFPLLKLGRKDIVNVSAGDGSRKAIGRIASGLSQQLATVAEPLEAQGWQLADELNRAFAGQAPSGFVSKPILVTTASFAKVDGQRIEDDKSFRQAYLNIWLKKIP